MAWRMTEGCCFGLETLGWNCFDEAVPLGLLAVQGGSAFALGASRHANFEISQSQRELVG